MCFSRGRRRPVAIAAICRARLGPSTLCPICPDTAAAFQHANAQISSKAGRGQQRGCSSHPTQHHTAGSLVLILQVTEGQRGCRRGRTVPPSSLQAWHEAPAPASNLTALRPDRFLASSQHGASTLCAPQACLKITREEAALLKAGRGGLPLPSATEGAEGSSLRG